MDAEGLALIEADGETDMEALGLILALGLELSLALPCDEGLLLGLALSLAELRNSIVNVTQALETSLEAFLVPVEPTKYFTKSPLALRSSPNPEVDLI